MRTITILAVAVIALACVVGCSSDGGPEVRKPVDAAMSRVEVDRTDGITADGVDQVTVTVTLVDASGYALEGRTVVIETTGISASTIVDQPTVPTNAKGVATATIRSTTAEMKQISAIVDPDTGAQTLDQRPAVQFIAGPASKLEFLVPPSDGAVGVSIGPAVQIAFADAHDNVVTSATSAITLAIANNPGNATLGGTTSVDAVAGIATFSDLVFDRPGTGYTLQASGAGVPAGTSVAFTVVVGAPAKLAFLDTPSTEVAGEAITPTLHVALLDAGGNTITTATDVVTVAIGFHSGPMLYGTRSVAAVAGVATFTDLGIDIAGTGYTLVATATGYAGASTFPFDVVPAAFDASVSTVAASPSTGVTADDISSSTITVTVTDAFGNGLAGHAVTLSATGTSNTIVQPASLTNASGVTTGTITSTHAETKTVSAAVGATTLTQTANVTFVAGPPAQIAITSGEGQGGVGGSDLAPFVVTVTDDNGNLVPNAGITFVVTLGNGTLSTTSQQTDASGMAATTLTLGTSGTTTVEAQYGSLFAVFHAYSLGAAAPVSFATGASHLALGDLNGDGKQDVVGTSGNFVTVSLNTTVPGAAATLAAAATFDTGSPTCSVAVGDLNGDGRPDLATSHCGSAATVSVLFNTTAAGATTPSFAAKVDFATDTFPDYVALADLNGDGRRDLVVASSTSNTVCVAFNTTALGAATPTFGAKTSFASGTAPQSLAIADFNGDGKRDVATASSGANTVSVLFNTAAIGAATPAFSAHTDFATGTGPTAVVAGDLNGDGKIDLATANLTARTVSVLFNTTATGGGSASFASKADVAISGSDIDSLSIGDLNCDGVPDLVASSQVLNGPARVIFNTTLPGAASPSFSAPFSLFSGQPAGIALGDVTADGLLDVAAHTSATTLALVANTSIPSTFAPGLAANVDVATTAIPYSVATADINGDGRPELVVANSDVSIFINKTTPGGTPSFAAANTTTVGGGVYVATGDLNGDGKPDVVAVRNGANVLSVLFNTTSPGAAAAALAAKVDFATGTGPKAVALADLNGDGKLDLVAPNFGTGGGTGTTVSVLFNTTAPGAATPTFAAKVDFTTATGPLSVSVRDLNGDGKPDVAAECAPANKVSVLFNTTATGAATPTFAAKVDIATGNYPEGIAIDDLNADGKPDLAVANNADSTTSILFNTTATGATSATFAAKADIAGGYQTIGVVTGDMNRDGRADFLSVIPSFSGGGSIFRSFNSTAAGVTTPTVTLSITSPPHGQYCSASSDLNGDGLADVIVGNVGVNSVSVFLGL